MCCITAIMTVAGAPGGEELIPGQESSRHIFRQIAEFEPMQGVLIRYPLGISYALIAELSQDVNVVTIVADSSEQSYVESQYTSHGVNLSHCSFLIAPSDSYWTRDYGPWFIFNNTLGGMEVIDFEYNRPYRPNDNAIPSAFASHHGFPLKYMDIVHTGGNYMTDGQGISVSTELVYTENPGLSSHDIDQLVHGYLGVHTYHVYPDPLGEYIEHVDCWAKYLSPKTIMVIEVSPSHSHYTDIEAAADYFENQLSCYGTPYNVVRVYVHLDEPYINSLIVNDKVFVPITGSQYDTGALAAYGAAMPGYEILGFTGSWQNTDALHCRAKGIPDQHMLYIKHAPLIDDEPFMGGFPLEATIIPYSGENLTNDPLLYWKTTGDWNTVSFTLDNNDSYQAQIPWHPHGTQLYYYIQASDESGRNETHPYIGAPGAHTFTVTMQPPQIEFIQVTPPTPHMGDPVNISAYITDNKGIKSVYLNLTYPNESTTNISITHNTINHTYYYNHTFNQTGQYAVTFWVTDTSNTSTQSTPVNFTIETSEIIHQSPLFPGWNLITVPLDNVWTAEMLGQNISGCTVVIMFNASTQVFVTHVVGTPHDDFSLVDGVGYYVFVLHDSFLNVTGLPILGVNVSLFTPWNLIGWYHGSSTLAESLGQALVDCTVVIMFDAVSQTFVTHVVDTPHDNFMVTQGMGLFIYVTTESWWQGEILG